MRTALLLSLVFALGACGGAREIETARPRVAVAPSGMEPATGTSEMRLVLDAVGGLPEGVTLLSIRVVAVGFHAEGAGWTRRPLTLSPVEIGPSLAGRVLFEGRLPAARYDSLAVVVDGPRIAFGPDAAGPLTVEANEARFPFAIDLGEAESLSAREALALRDLRAPSSATTARVHFDTARALMRRPDCRWRFSLAFSATPPAPFVFDTPIPPDSSGVVTDSTAD